MPTTVSAAAVAATLLAYVAVIMLPGLLVGAAAGLRGWLLAGIAPVLTYALAGLVGPWLSGVGLPFSLVTFAVAVVLVAALAWGVARRVSRTPRSVPHMHPPRRQAHPRPRIWTHAAHLAAVACVLTAAGIGLYTVLSGMGAINAIPQGWDAAFHANGVRYIAESGDGSLTGMGSVNKYGDGTAPFYPNAYHLVAAVAYQLTGASIPAVLNANSMLLPGLLALSLVTLVRASGGRAVLAGSVALASAAPATLLYASISRGPLLPFLLGVALLPAALAALRRFLDATNTPNAIIVGLCAISLLTIHTSTVFSVLLFAVPLLIQHMITSGRRSIGADLRWIGAVAAACAVLTIPQLAGVIGRAASDYPQVNWPAELSVSEAVGTLLTFQHAGVEAQMWLTGTAQLWLTPAIVIGLLSAFRLAGLRWIVGAATVTGVLWVAVATSDAPAVLTVTQPWWNDPFRLLALATLPMAMLAGHGLAEVQARLRDALGAQHRALPSAALGAVLLATFVAGSNVLYTSANAEVVRAGHGSTHDDRVSADEAAAMLRLAELAVDDEWAMNDRYDGTVWTYAISGVRTVAAHYDHLFAPTDAALLQERFRDYADDAEVRAAVERLGVRWVIVGKHGFMRGHERAPGLDGYADLPFLTRVYDNPGAAIYLIEPS